MKAKKSTYGETLQLVERAYSAGKIQGDYAARRALRKSQDRRLGTVLWVAEGVLWCVTALTVVLTGMFIWVVAHPEIIPASTVYGYFTMLVLTLLLVGCGWGLFGLVVKDQSRG